MSLTSISRIADTHAVHGASKSEASCAGRSAPAAARVHVAREAVWIAIGQALAAIGGVASIKLLTHALPPTQFGELSLGLTVAAFAQGGLACLSQAFLRFLSPAQEAGQLRPYLSAVASLVRQASGLHLLALVVVVAVLLATGMGQWTGLTIAAALFALTSGYCVALDGIQNALRDRATVALHQAASQWLRALGAAGLVAIWRPSSSVALLGFVAGTLLVSISQAHQLRHRLRGVPSPRTCDARLAADWRSRMITYAAPFGSWFLFTTIQTCSGRWALQYFADSAAVGLYSAIYQVGFYPILLLSGMFTQLVTPILFSRAGDGADAKRTADTLRLNNRLVVICMLVTLLMTLTAYWLHEPILALLAAPEYLAVSTFLPWLVLAGGLQTSAQAATLSVLVVADSRRLALPKIVTAIAGTVGTVIGAWGWGLAGVVIASLAFSAVFCLWILAILLFSSLQSPTRTSATPV